MAIAFDAVAIPSAALYTATFSWTHTPVGTPKGVAVIVVQEGSTDQVSGVTYGGVAMDRVRSDVRTATEPGRVYIYFLGSGIPTGAQTVQVTLTGASDTNAVSLTVTSGADSAVDVSNGLDAGIIANPSLTIVPTVAAVIFYGIFSGLAAPVTTVQTGSTHVAGKDYGTDSAMWARKSVAAGGSTTIGYTAASDDVCHTALAIKEATPVTVTLGTASLVTAKYIPVVVVTNNITVILGAQVLSTTKYIPTVLASDNKTVILGTPALTTTKYTPSVIKGAIVVPNVIGFALATYIPTIIIESVGITVTPSTASLTTTRFVPVILVSAHKTVIPNTINLVITRFAPVANLGLILIPNANTLALATYIPIIGVGANTTVIPATRALILSRFIPLVFVFGYKLNFVDTDDTLTFATTKDSLKFTDIDDTLGFTEVWK